MTSPETRARKRENARRFREAHPGAGGVAWRKWYESHPERHDEIRAKNREAPRRRRVRLAVASVEQRYREANCAPEEVPP